MEFQRTALFSFEVKTALMLAHTHTHSGLKSDSILNNHTKQLKSRTRRKNGGDEKTCDEHVMNMCISFIDSVPYSEKKRLLDKQEEIQEVKQLEEWKPAVGIVTALLEELENRAS